MGAHDRQPFQRGEYLRLFAILGHIDAFPLLIQGMHMFPGERRPDNVTGQVFHGRFVTGRYAVAAEDVEAEKTPVGQHGDHFPGDLPLC